MRLVVLGTGAFAVPMLERLHGSSHEVVGVVTRPPRGRRPEPSPVQRTAERLGLQAHTPETVNSDAGRDLLGQLDPKLLVVCDYGEILKPPTLAVARLGGINLHGSLLPKYRGAAPVAWAILRGERETGNTVIQMTPSLDAGPCLAQDRLAIDPEETAGELEVRLAARGAPLVLAVVDSLAAGTAAPIQQEQGEATRAPRLTKQDGQIDWSQSPAQIKNHVRAMQPWPKAFTDWRRGSGAPVRLIVLGVWLDPDAAQQTAEPHGTIVQAAPHLLVATGEGLLELTELQPAGKRPMSSAEFVRGYPIRPGDHLSDAPA